MAALVIGCGSSSSSGEASPFANSLRHVFPPVYLDVGEEVADVCQSWTLDNEEPLYVNAVRQTNEGGWHHSNSTFGPEEVFDGPDGTWNCDDRGYALQFAVAAGGVLFAQSAESSTIFRAAMGRSRSPSGTSWGATRHEQKRSHR